jgi:hypothetical protein
MRAAPERRTVAYVACLALAVVGCAVLDTVSARLSTISPRALDAQVELRADDPHLVAEAWLRAQGLASAGEASH